MQYLIKISCIILINMCENQGRIKAQRISNFDTRLTHIFQKAIKIWFRRQADRPFCRLPASFKTSAQIFFHLLNFSPLHGEEKTTQKPSLSKTKKTRLKRPMIKKCLHEGTKPNLQLNSGKSERLLLLWNHQIKLYCL